MSYASGHTRQWSTYCLTYPGCPRRGLLPRYAWCLPSRCPHNVYLTRAFSFLDQLRPPLSPTTKKYLTPTTHQAIKSIPNSHISHSPDKKSPIRLYPDVPVQNPIAGKVHTHPGLQFWLANNLPSPRAAKSHVSPRCTFCNSSRSIFLRRVARERERESRRGSRGQVRRRAVTPFAQWPIMLLLSRTWPWDVCMSAGAMYYQALASLWNYYFRCGEVWLYLWGHARFEIYVQIFVGVFFCRLGFGVAGVL